MMTDREQEVLSLIRENPMMPQQLIATRLGMSRSAVAGHIMKLTGKGVIKGRGYVLSDAPFIAVIGGASIDIHGKSNKALRANDSNPGTVNTSAGGVARNIAENLARLGVDCRLITAVGDDHYGQMLLRRSRDAGIDTQYVHEFAAATTSTYLSVLDNSGEMQVAIADMRVMDRLGAAQLQPQQAMLQQSSLIILDCNLADDALAWVTGTFAAKPIFADTVSTTKAIRMQPYLRYIHTLKTSTIEAEALTGMQARTQSQLRKVAGQLHADGVQRLFITRGDKGVFYSTGDAQGIQKLPRRAHEVNNASGAGDAFLAGLAYAWLEDRELGDSIRFALTAADITLAHPATSSPALTLDAISLAMGTQRAG